MKNSPYHIQSEKQRDLVKALSAYPHLVIRPGNPPILFELMGQLGLSSTQKGDRLLLTSSGVRQVLSIQWSELRLCSLNKSERTLFLSNGEHNMLEIQAVKGSLSKLRPLVGLMQALPRPPKKKVRLELHQGWHLEYVKPDDRHAYLLHLNDPLIYQHTTNIPYPYDTREADRWISTLDLRQSKLGQACNLAIRNPKGQLCGGIGLDFSQAETEHMAEIGYWLAKPYWNQGIMSQALQSFCGWAFSSFQLKRISARILVDNLASERVLLKSGFVLEGSMTNHFFKAGTLRDGRLYALTRS